MNGSLKIISLAIFLTYFPSPGATCPNGRCGYSPIPHAFCETPMSTPLGTLKCKVALEKKGQSTTVCSLSQFSNITATFKNSVPPEHEFLEVMARKCLDVLECAEQFQCSIVWCGLKYYACAIDTCCLRSDEIEDGYLGPRQEKAWPDPDNS